MNSGTVIFLYDFFISSNLNKISLFRSSSSFSSLDASVIVLRTGFGWYSPLAFNSVRDGAFNELFKELKPSRIIIMDNASFHKSQKTLDSILSPWILN